MLRKSWFTAGLNQLKAVPEDSLSPTSALQLEPTSTITAFTPSLPSLTPPSPDEQLQLPLSREMALYVKRIVERCGVLTGYHRRFGALLKTYDQLSELILHTIRIDVRSRVAYYLGLAMRHVSAKAISATSQNIDPQLQGNYCIEQEIGEPDPHIIDLNLELGEYHNIVSSTLPPREQK